MTRRLAIRHFVLLSCLFLLAAGRSNAMDSATPEGVQSAFARMKQAIGRQDAGVITANCTPDTITVFAHALELARNPSSTNLESRLSQLEVIVGLQTYAQIPESSLQSMSATNLFEWAVQNNVINIRGLAELSLDKIKVVGDVATALLIGGEAESDKAPVSYRRYDGRWKLDLKSLLQLSEDSLAEVRARQGLGKVEMAVIALEAKNKKPIPALRELLLDPHVRQLASALKGRGGDQVYAAVIGELSAGRQSVAEELLDNQLPSHTNDHRLVFARAACARSRWNKREAQYLFVHVLEMNPASQEGRCARYVLDLDAGEHVPENMNALLQLTRMCPDNPLIQWMMAAECRDRFKQTNQTTYSPQAEVCYRRMLTIFRVGPVLLHQTFANVLDEELGKPEEAIEHRRLAVKLEPASWTYQGLANTLAHMKRFPEANEAYAKLVEMAPDDVQYWVNWGNSLLEEGRYADSAQKFEQAVRCDPTHVRAQYSLGRALEKQGKKEEALASYRKTMDLDPSHANAFEGATRILSQLGRTGELERATTQWAKSHGWRPEEDPMNPWKPVSSNFLASIKGADLKTINTVFGAAGSSQVVSPNSTVYTLNSWHGWNMVVLRVTNAGGLVDVHVGQYMQGHARLDEWKTAVRRDFGIAIDHVRIVMLAPGEKDGPCYAEIESRVPGVKRITLSVRKPQVLDPAGSTLSALGDSAVANSMLTIMF